MLVGVYASWLPFADHRVTDSWDFGAYLLEGADASDSLWIVPSPFMWLHVEDC